MSYATVPSNASLKPAPFHPSVSDSALKSLHTLLEHSPVGPETYENLNADVKDFTNYGVSRKWVSEARDRWQNGYDWRQTEKKIDSFPNYTVELEDSGSKFTIHFVALFSKKSDALPLLLMHGWPGSFLEFLGVLKELKEKYSEEDLPFNVVVPSLPGYGYSSGPPLDQDFGMPGMARLMDSLMRGLGLSGYVAQGGDIGSFLARILGARADACRAVHVNFCPGDPPTDEEVKALRPDEQKGLQRAQHFKDIGRAYALMHASRPATIGLVLSSSPIALLSWIGEKFLQWTDTSPSIDEILDSVTLYWFTNSFSRAIYPYRGIFSKDNRIPHVDKPMGYSRFPKEIAPNPTSLVAKNGNLVWHREHEAGGHFAAMEKPNEFLKDVEDFVKEACGQGAGAKI